MSCLSARLHRLRKKSLNEWRNFTGCGKTHVLYQDTSQPAEKSRSTGGTGSQAAEKLMFCISAPHRPPEKVAQRRARLYRLRKNSCFVSGHDFSRAVSDAMMRAKESA